MKKKVLIRKADPGDIDAIKEILFGALTEYGIPLPENYSVADIDAIGDLDGNQHVFVLAGQDRLSGFLVLRPISEECLELKRIYVAKSERGKKLGTRLLNHTIKFAADAGYSSIRLETTSKFYEAVSLYKKNGFKELTGVDKAPGHDLAFERIL